MIVQSVSAPCWSTRATPGLTGSCFFHGFLINMPVTLYYVRTDINIRTNSLFAKVRETLEYLPSTFDNAEYGEVNVKGFLVS